MTATYSTAPTLLVAIDISKHRHEVLIGDPGKKRRRHSRLIQLKLTCQTGSRSSTAPPRYRQLPSCRTSSVISATRRPWFSRPLGRCRCAIGGHMLSA